MDNTFITVFTPTYNRPNEPERLHLSLISQTDFRFERLIVDDGSTDDTENMVASWLDTSPLPIRYIKQPNSGKHVAQSDLSRVFGLIRGDLKAGRDVLFVGTPCQCAAIKSLFGKYSNLATVDLVCEGVPSRQMYADFLDDLEDDRGERVKDFRFRDKRGGWSTKNAVVLGQDGRALEKQPHSYYYYYYWMFSKALILRDSCYGCPYACGRRTGDVTVGDLWGAETAGLGYGLVELEAGISCALANTELGRTMLKKAGLELKRCSLRTISRSNGCLEKPSSCDWDTRKRILTAYAEDRAAGMRREYERTFTAKAKLRADVAANMPLPLRVALKRAKAIAKGGKR